MNVPAYVPIVELVALAVTLVHVWTEELALSGCACFHYLWEEGQAPLAWRGELESDSVSIRVAS